MNITQKFIAKSRKNSDNTHSILFRIICNREIIYVNTGVRVHPAHWDKRNGRIKSSHPFASLLEPQLEEFAQKLNAFKARLCLDDETITVDKIKALFVVKEIQTKDFYEFVEYELTLNNKQYKPLTITQHRCHLRHLKEFAPVLNFDQITTGFLEQYEKHLASCRGNDTNTVHGKLKFIRTYINVAIRKGLIEKYVFRGYRLKRKPAKPRFMALSDFSQLEQYFEQTTRALHRNHLRYFLFACTTGLRYGDLKQLRWEHLQEGSVYIRMQKTGEVISIPISTRAMKYLPGKADSGFIFKVPTNQVANRILKDIGAAAGTKQTLSTHVARHTFATLSLNIGIPLHVVQKLLGHASLKTTEIYARVIDKTVSDEIKKWENI